MTKTQRLYGLDVQPSLWTFMSYKDALTLKAELAWHRIAALNKAGYLWKDSANITDCVNAIKFNENLIKELYEV